MTFSEWKRLELVREYIPQMLQIDLEKLSTWREYIAAVYYADRSNFHGRVDALCEKLLERDELISLMGSFGRWITRQSPIRSHSNTASPASCQGSVTAVIRRGQ